MSYNSQKIGGDPIAGERLFYDRSIGTGGRCSLCHSLEKDLVLVGPSLAGIGLRAETRISGMSGEEYLRESILAPDAYIVEGFPVGQMLPDLDEKLNPDQIDDLVAFLLSLK
jgi:cytochrome c